MQSKFEKCCPRLFHYGAPCFFGILFCRICCIIFSLVMGFLTATLGNSFEVNVTIKLWKPVFTSNLFYVITVIHTYGIISMFFSLKRKKKQKKILGIIESTYEKYFGEHGIYGIFGPRYESILIIREAMEIPTYTYLAYEMSFLISDTSLPTILAGTIILNCTMMPYILHAAPIKRTKKRIYALVLDTALDLFMGIIIPLAVVLPPALAYIENPYHKSSLEWTTDGISRCRYMLVSSAIDLIATTIPIIGIHLYLGTLHYAWSYESFHKRDTTLKVDVSVKGSSTFIIPEKRRSWKKVVALLSFAWGVAVAVVVVDSFSHTKCADTPMATLPLAPWLTPKSECYTLMVSVDHVKQPEHSMEEIFSTIENDFNLDLIRTAAFARCPNKETPKFIQKMKNLQILIYKFSEIKTLELDFQKLPSLFAIMIFGNRNMKAVPQSLKHLLPSVFRLMMMDNPLEEIPEWVSQSWRNLRSLRLAGTGILTNFSILATLPQLEELDIGENLLESIPVEFENAFLSMKVLILRGNALKSIPKWPSIAEIPYVDLDGNDIRSFNDIPWSLAEVNGRKRSATSLLSLSYNPICNDPLLSTSYACVNDCAPLCNGNRHLDFACQPPCNVSSCSFDNGQCTTDFA